MFKIKKNFHLILTVVILMCIYVACVSIEKRPKESEFPLQITPQSSSTQIWVGEDGRTYILTWGEPVYIEAEK